MTSCAPPSRSGAHSRSFDAVLFHDRAIHGQGIQDISWFDASGQEMTDKDWQTGYVRCLGVRLSGDLIGGTDERGDLVMGDTVLLLMNAHYEAIPFMLPPLKKGQRWEPMLDTAPEPLPFEGEPLYELQGRSMAAAHDTAVQPDMATSWDHNSPLHRRTSC